MASGYFTLLLPPRAPLPKVADSHIITPLLIDDWSLKDIIPGRSKTSVFEEQQQMAKALLSRVTELGGRL